jgi:hypothetical protein
MSAYYQAPASLPQGPLPVQVAVAGPVRQQRLTVLFRLILAVPHFFMLYFLGIAATVVVFIGWWAALFTGRLPDFAATFLTGYMRWYTRVAAYMMLLTDVYPPFSLEDDPYPVRIAVAQQRLNPLAVFFRIILVIPASLLRLLLTIGAGSVVAFIAWLITLISGELPQALHLAYAAVLRYSTRLDCYFYLLTPAYPSALLGDATAAPGAGWEPTASGYGTAGGYAAPGRYGIPQPPLQPADWLLILSPTARQLVIVFMVIGALFFVAWIGVGLAIAGTSTTPTSTTAALWANA